MLLITEYFHYSQLKVQDIPLTCYTSDKARVAKFSDCTGFEI